MAAVGERLVDSQRMAQSPTVVAGVIVMVVGGSPRIAVREQFRDFIVP